jgi:hypothetical protein
MVPARVEPCRPEAFRSPACARPRHPGRIAWLVQANWHMPFGSFDDSAHYPNGERSYFIAIFASDGGQGFAPAKRCFAQQCD